MAIMVSTSSPYLVMLHSMQSPTLQCLPLIALHVLSRYTQSRKALRS